MKSGEFVDPILNDRYILCMFLPRNKNTLGARVR